MATGYQLGSYYHRTWNPNGIKLYRYTIEAGTYKGTKVNGYDWTGDDLRGALTQAYDKYSTSEGYRTSGQLWTSASFSSSYLETIEQFTYYNFSVAASGGGGEAIITALPSSSNRYLKRSDSLYFIESGQSVTAKANVTDDDYYFSQWSDGVKNNPRTVTVTSDTTLTAVFVKKPLLTVEAGANGTITTDPSGYVTPNTTARAVATPNEGYRFVGWYSNGQKIYDTATADLQVYSSDITYIAQFVSMYHTVTVGLSDSSPAESATVKMYVGGVETASGTSIIEGTEVQIVCTAKVDYNFSQWLINNVGRYTSSYTFIVSSTDDASITCLAVMTEKNSYNLSVSKVENNRGTVGLADSEKSWTETNNTISAIGHSGVRYTVTANVTSDTSAAGHELNKFVGFTKNGNNLAYTEVTAGYEYQAQFVNGSNLSSESLDDIAIVATFAQKTLYHAETEVNYAERGTALITPDPDITSPTNKWLEGTITTVATPATGMEVTSFNVQDIDAGGHGFVVNDPVKDADGKFRCSFTLNFNAKIIVNFQAIPCTVAVNVHSASIGKGTATVASTAQGGSTDNMKYGDVAIYTATPYATPEPGYQFSGWYYADGTTVPDSIIITQGVSHTYHYYDAEYRVALTGNLTLYARFKAKVTIGLSNTASASGSVTLDDQTTSSSSIYKWVELGSTCNVVATPSSGGTSFFGAWYASTDTEFENPLDIAATETLTVTNTISYVARFVSSADALYVAMCNYDNDTNLPDATLGNLLMRTSGSTPQEVTTCTEAQFLAATGLSTAPAGAVKYYTLVGTSRVSVIASPAMGRGFNKWTRLAIIDGTIDTEVQLGLTSTLSTVVNRHFIYRAYWGDPKPVEITLNYCIGSNVTMGNLNIEGVTVTDASIENKTATATKTKATYTQNDVVKIFVDIKNGYLFDGWYYDDTHESQLRDSTVGGVTYKYTDAEYRFMVTSPVTICAKFKEDTNALYKWEGSSENKMMDWKSKVYVASRPFDPTAVRVDATGYSVGVGGSLTLTIGMFSSPDSEPSSTRQVSIGSQDMRRVPARRPERYVQLEIQNNNDVNAVFVGTSSNGLNA